MTAATSSPAQTKMSRHHLRPTSTTATPRTALTGPMAPTATCRARPATTTTDLPTVRHSEALERKSLGALTVLPNVWIHEQHCLSGTGSSLYKDTWMQFCVMLLFCFCFFAMFFFLLSSFWLLFLYSFFWLFLLEGFCSPCILVHLIIAVGFKKKKEKEKSLHYCWYHPLFH